jgi:hypothetical protein
MLSPLRHGYHASTAFHQWAEKPYNRVFLSCLSPPPQFGLGKKGKECSNEHSPAFVMCFILQNELSAVLKNIYSKISRKKINITVDFYLPVLQE